jgi:hypothetical protein
MDEKTKVLLLGTFHFAHSEGHIVDIEVDDIMSAKKQNELNELVQKLLQFKPNKIAVEAQRAKDKKLNEAYSAYCTNPSNITDETIAHRNEIVQLAFRLGHMLKHPKIYPIDYPVNLPDKVYEYAEKNCPEFYNKFMNEIKEYGNSEDKFMNNNTILEVLKHLNDPQRAAKEQSDFYLNMAQVGAWDTYYGVDMLTEWYRRNLYILGNLQSIAEPGDRILIIYGAGHCKILQDLIKEYNGFEFVDPLTYL